MQNIKADAYNESIYNDLSNLTSLIQEDFSQKIPLSGEDKAHEKLFESLNSMIEKVQSIIRDKEEVDVELQETKEKLNRYINHFEYKVALRTEKLEKEIFERRKMEERYRESEKKMKHLNLVLRAIRNINHLIINEKNRKKLLEGVCHNLVENRCYNGVWIMLVDEEGNPVDYSEAGTDKPFTPFKKINYRSELPECVLNSLKISGLRIIDNTSECACCQGSDKNDANGVLDFSVRLEYGGKAYGVLHGHLAEDFALIEEEQELFSEVAGDLAYALHNIELKNESNKTKEELIRAKEKAEESDRLKSAFLANISHEIRTPMTGILGFTDFLRDKTISEEDRDEYIDMIENSGERMLNLINDLMDMSKIETGQLNVKSEETNINQVIEGLYSMYKPKTKEKDLDFSYQIFFTDKGATFYFTLPYRKPSIGMNNYDL